MRYALVLMIGIFAFTGCGDDDAAPTNLALAFDIADTGMVTITPSGDNVSTFSVDFGDGTGETATVLPGNSVTRNYPNGTFTVTLLAASSSGATATISESITVMADDSAGQDAGGMFGAGVSADGTVLDFENGIPTFQSIPEGSGVLTNDIDNPDPSGINTSGRVASTFRVNGAEAFAGVFFDLAAPLDFSAGTTVTAQVWIPAGTSPLNVRMAIENQGNGFDSQVPIDFGPVTTEEEWVEVSFDFSSRPVFGPGLDPDLPYDRIVFIVDIDQPGDDTTYFFDNISLVGTESAGGGNTGGGTGEPVSILDFEGDVPPATTIPTDDARITFQVIPNPDPSGINTSDMVGETFRPVGAQAFAGTFFDLPAPIDFSQSTVLTAQVWIPAGTAPLNVRMAIENQAIGFDTQVPIDFFDVNVEEEWVEVTFDYSTPPVFGAGFNPSLDYDRIVFIVDIDQEGDDSTFFFDNIVNPN